MPRENQIPAVDESACQLLEQNLPNSYPAKTPAKDID
jgi:hypothetical protein